MSNSNKFTPGPWRVEHDEVQSFIVATGDDSCVAITADKTQDFKSSSANAALIAAAPEMLEALERVESELLDVDMEVPEYLTKAIARARGES